VSIVGEEAVAFSLFIELNCRNVEGCLKLPQRRCGDALRGCHLYQEERLPATGDKEVYFAY
jgi:hypothetical protein